MALAAELISSLKTELRAQGLTYGAVATHLQLSESSVKRLFREKDMSLARLESICTLAGLDIGELCSNAEKARRHVSALSLEHEQLLVSDERLFLLAVHLIYGWTFEQILDLYDLDKHDSQRYLTTLDKMRVLELLPENRVRVLLSPDFDWIKGGPIQNFFEQTAQGDFFESDFSGEGELRLVVNGWMSVESIKAFHDRLRRLAREFDAHKEFDKHSPAEKRRGTSLVLAIRPWSLGIFDKYRR